VAGPGNILIKVGADAGQAIRELSTLDKTLGETQSTSSKMSAGLKKAALPAAAALGAIGFAAVGAAKAAAEDAAAQEHLAGVLQRTTGASDAAIASTEAWISKTALATGVADDELRPALEKIVTATHDTVKAQKLMSAALDISAASGKDVDTVSAAIAKAYTGQTGALEKLIPGLSEAAKKSNDFDTIMGELAKTTGGAAAKSADTAAGQYKILTVQMGELQEELGAALLPIIQALLPVLRSLASFASENTKAIQILVGVVAALAAGILIANAAIKVYNALQIAAKAATAIWTAAQWLLNAALDANPIGLVIIAIAALAAGLVIAYKKSETFRDIVDAAFAIVKRGVQALDVVFDNLLAAATAAFNWIVGHWKLALFAFGPIGAAIYIIERNWDTLKDAALTAAGAVEGVVDRIRAAFGKIEGFTFGALEGAIRGIAGALDAVIAAVQSLISWLGRIHVPSIHLPNLPGPLMPATSSSSSSPSAGTHAAAAGTTINVYGAVDVEGTARAIRRVLINHDRRQGRL
jgi:hypothetical protein